ncbi:hypothetical protein ZWY2020_035587 [Hordeum vulgare]|nr:hypothetical protein ZWY2020_035587 [Hordeum vulgare]
MACYAALLHQPPASPSPCTSGRAGSCRVRPPRSTGAEPLPVHRARISRAAPTPQLEGAPEQAPRSSPRQLYGECWRRRAPTRRPLATTRSAPASSSAPGSGPASRADSQYLLQGLDCQMLRTVKGFINAGFAGIILEDQVSPKACGHTQGRKVVSREEAIMHKGAVDARKESGSDIVIVARTDSRQALSLDEPDVLFIDALASREEMMAPLELEEIGYKIIDALVAITGGRIPPPSSLPSFEEIKDTLGFNRYYEEEKRYVASPAQSSFGSGNYDYTSGASGAGDTKLRTDKPQEPIIDILPQLYDPGSAGGRGPSSGMWSLLLRLKITGRAGVQKIDARIPAGFLEGMTKVIPGLAGTNIMERLGMRLWIRTTPRMGRYCLILRTAWEIGSSAERDAMERDWGVDDRASGG